MIYGLKMYLFSGLTVTYDVLMVFLRHIEHFLK